MKKQNASGITPLECWDQKAQEWDGWIGKEGDFNRRYNTDPVLWRFLGDVSGLAVLDAGCGTGYLCNKLAQKGARVTGVDFSPRMIEVAKRNTLNNQIESLWV